MRTMGINGRGHVSRYAASIVIVIVLAQTPDNDEPYIPPLPQALLDSISFEEAPPPGEEEDGPICIDDALVPEEELIETEPKAEPVDVCYGTLVVTLVGVDHF